MGKDINPEYKEWALEPRDCHSLNRGYVYKKGVGGGPCNGRGYHLKFVLGQDVYKTHTHETNTTNNTKNNKNWPCLKGLPFNAQVHNKSTCKHN